MKAPLFEFPFYQYQGSDWNLKKKALFKEINKHKFIRNDLATPTNLAYNVCMETDRLTNKKSYVRYLENILRPELSEFSEEVEVDFYKENAWCGRYRKGDCQGVHNHRSWGFSGILYLEFDPRIHTSTLFAAPWQDPVSDTVHINAVQDVEEGTLLIFPSYCLHCVTPSRVSKPRTIIAFDMLPTSVTK